MRIVEIYTHEKELPVLLPGNPLHSAEVFTMIKASGKAKPIMIVCRDENREIAHLLAVRHQGWRFIPFGLHTWYSVYGEGVYSEECKDREEVYALLLDKLFVIFDLRHTFIEIRNLSDARFAYDVLSKRNFFPRRSLRIYNSLHGRHPIERLTRSYRTHIRQAEARGVTYGRATTQAEIDEGIRLLRNYYATKIRRKFPNRKLIKTMLVDEKGNHSKLVALFVVRYNNRIIGSSLCLYTSERVYLAYSCGLRKRHPLLYPGIMAVWAAISDAHNFGYSHFEFLESNMLAGTHSGFINLILNFGGKQVSTRRWYHVQWNWMNKILRKIYV